MIAQIGKLEEVGVALFYLTDQQKSYFAGRVKLKNNSFVLHVYHGSATQKETSWNEGLISFDERHWFQLRCKEIH